LIVDLSLSHINMWAVIVSAIAAFVVGGVWYGALFCKAWAWLHQYEEAQLSEMQKTQARTFGVFIGCDLVTAVVLSLLIANLYAEPSMLSGICAAVLLWLGIGATDAAAQNAAHRKPLSAYLIDTRAFSILL
jgi:threonine/homoserine/homoserine lactone efflux protein